MSKNINQPPIEQRISHRIMLYIAQCESGAVNQFTIEDIVREEVGHENARLRVALADAIRRPMGVVPASADGLVTPDEMQAAEERRKAKIKPKTI